MKKIKVLLLAVYLPGLLLLAKPAQSQWYSYDGFEKKKMSPDSQYQLINSLNPGLAPALAPGMAITDAMANAALTGAKGYAFPAGGYAFYSADQKKLWYLLKATNLKMKRSIFFPVRNMDEAEAFFESSDDITAADDEGVFKVEHAYLNYLSGSRKLAAYTEPLSDFIGPVRVSLGLLALAPSVKDSANTTEQSEKDWNRKLFNDRFKSGGGIAQLNIMYPVIHLHDNKYLDFKCYASPRFSIDVPKEDTGVQRFAHHTQLGMEAQLKIKTAKDNFNFLLCFRGMQAWGNTTFMDNMGFTGKDRKSFNFNTWTVGVIAKKHLAVYYTWYSGDTRAINQVPQKNNQSLTANYQF